MDNLPILQELFESDTVIILLVGIVIAAVIGLRLKNTKKCIIGSVGAAAGYMVCEAASNIRTNFMLEIILLFIGTFTMGCFIGFIISYILLKYRARS